MKYVLYIDYCSTAAKAYEYKAMTANNITDAIIEAGYQFTNEMYLIRIMQKVGKTTTEKGIKREIYKAILCERASKRWHKNNNANGEREHNVARYTGYNTEWYELVTE